MDAWKDAGLSIENNENPDWDSGTIFGTGTSGIEKFRESIYKIDDFQTRRLGSTVVAQTMNSGISAYLAGKLGLGNQVSTNSSACTTGTESILMGYDRIISGQANRMLIGSTSDSGPYIWAGFDAMKVCTFKHNESPEKGSRPMSATASGFVPGSGAGALLLEDLESALARGARIYGEVLGGGMAADAYHLTGTHPEGEGAFLGMQEAIHDAGITTKDINYINAHATSTPLGDKSELIAIKRLFGANPTLNISATKSMTGHLLGAAGAIEAIACVLATLHDTIPPTINTQEVDPDFVNDFDYTLQKAQHKIVNYALSNTFGFGGHIASVVVGKYK